MIVRAHGSGCLLISQPAHAALARRIMEHWEPLAREPRRDSILLAIAEHDNGWSEPDARPVLDHEGGVADFVHTDRPARQGVWPRGVARLESRDAWAAALVAQHAATVYGRFRGDPEWSAFFAEMEAARDRLTAGAGQSRDALAHDYTYLRLGDLISLTFCTGWSDEQSYRQWRLRLENGRCVRITPAQLDRAELPVEVEALALPATSFRSGAELDAALRAATRTRLTGVVMGGA